MAENRKIVKVFLASPSDLCDERKSAKVVIEETNALLADEFGYQVELVGWEDTVSVFGRPQATINRELERCEFFIGLMWRKWGTPPDVASDYSSGFEEEYATSINRRESEGRPEISLFFKEIDPQLLTDPGEDLKKVLAFKNRLVEEKKILYEGFTDIRDFETKIRRCIFTYLKRLRTQDSQDAALINQAPTPGGEKQQVAAPANAPAETPLSIKGATFLRDFIAKTEDKAEFDTINAPAVARFRLLATLVGRQGNDERVLGVHDANLLFSEASKFDLGDRELDGLVSTGLRYYAEENTPIWRWLAAIKGFTAHLLPFYSVMGSDTIRRTGALTAMRIIAEPLPNDRNFFLETWLAEKSPGTLKVAALDYLFEWGEFSDLEQIRDELERGDNQTVSAAANAIIRISLRDSREKGFEALYDLQPTTVSTKVLKELFDDPERLGNATLESGIGHRNAQVRRKIVELLRIRKSLSVETAEQLFADSNAEVRYEALLSLADAGRTFSEEDAKKIISTDTRSGGLRRDAQFGMLGSLYSDVAKRCLAQFISHRLRSLNDKALNELALESSIFNQTAQFVLTERHFKLHGDELRRRVDDQYQSTFNLMLNALSTRIGNDASETIEKIRSLQTDICKEFTRQGLDIICRNGDSRDLTRVRLALKGGFVACSDLNVEYLGTFGDWEDIPLIIAAVKHPVIDRDEGIIWAKQDVSRHQIAARTIYKLGRHRLPELLALALPSALLDRVIAESSDKGFSGLSESSIMDLLNFEGDHVRKIAAIKCLKVFSKRRIAKLLVSYISSNATHSYNVIHWLDFGQSAPHERVLGAAERLLNAEWRN